MASGSAARPTRADYSFLALSHLLRVALLKLIDLGAWSRRTSRPVEVFWTFVPRLGWVWPNVGFSIASCMAYLTYFPFSATLLLFVLFVRLVRFPEGEMRRGAAGGVRPSSFEGPFGTCSHARRRRPRDGGHGEPADLRDALRVARAGDEGERRGRGRRAGARLQRRLAAPAGPRPRGTPTSRPSPAPSGPVVYEAGARRFSDRTLRSSPRRPRTRSPPFACRRCSSTSTCPPCETCRPALCTTVSTLRETSPAVRRREC